MELGTWAEWFSGVASSAAVATALHTAKPKKTRRIFRVNKKMNPQSVNPKGLPSLVVSNISNGSGYYVLAASRVKLTRDGQWAKYAPSEKLYFTVAPNQEARPIANSLKSIEPFTLSADKIFREDGTAREDALQRARTPWFKAEVAFLDSQHRFYFWGKAVGIRIINDGNETMIQTISDTKTLKDIIENFSFME